MSKGGKGGGGSVSAPQVGVNQGITQTGQVFQNLGTYGSEIMGGLGSLGNWAANLATGGNAQVNGTMPANGILSDTGSQVFAPFSAGGTSGGGGGGGGLFGLSQQQLGPFLSNAVRDILQAQGATKYLKPLLTELPLQANTELNSGNALIGAGTRMLGQATSGAGLFPSQQAYINQAVQTQQNQISQQLADAGLSASTQRAQLLGQASMSGAAAAGQLIQGNIQSANQTIQVGEAEQQIGQDTQKIDLATQEALFTQFGTLSQLSSGLQAQVWTQALQGYGMLGQFMQNTMSAFGYELKSAEDAQQVMEFDASLQMQAAQINAGAQQAASQGFSSMLGSLGGLLGGGSGGGGGLLGGLGGLLGGGAATGGAGAFGTVGGFGTAAASAGAAGSLGSLGGGIGGLLGSLGGLIALF